MTNDKILTTAGVGIKDTTQLNSYVELMKDNLKDSWQLADDFIESHVCFIRNDYLDKVSDKNKEKSQVLVIINRKKGLNFYDHKYQINPPITARKVEYILNKISNEVSFHPIQSKNDNINNNESLFGSFISKFKKSFMGEDIINETETIQQKRSKELNRLSKTFDVKDAIENKIVFIGTPGSGKSTIIQTASNTAKAENEIQSNTGIDFATMQLNERVKLSLIGTPGEVNSDFLWDIVGKSANAFVIILDLSRPELFDYLKKYLSYIKSQIGKVENLFCVLTHSDDAIDDLQEVKTRLKEKYQFIKRTYVIDPRQKKHVMILLDDIYKNSNSAI
jgi:small GTP-binding protein